MKRWQYIRVLGMHPLISMQTPHSHQSPFTIHRCSVFCVLFHCVPYLPHAVCVCVCCSKKRDEVPGGGAIRTVNYLKF